MTSPTEAEPTPAKPEKRVRRRARRSRTVGFVAGFFIITFLLLAGYRAMVETTLMSRYLYYVAVHTNWVLSFVGYSSELEGGVESTGREAAMRAELAAWQAGEEPPKILPESEPGESPLTTWEMFQHRVYSNTRHAQTDQARYDKLMELSNPQQGTPEELRSFLQERIDTLRDLYQEPVHRPGPDGELKTAYRTWGDPMANSALQEARSMFADLPDADADPQAFTQQVNVIAQKLDESRRHQLQYLQQSIASRTELGIGKGPIIVYIHEPSLTQRIQDLREQQTRLASEEHLADAEKKSRTEAIDAQIAALRENSDADSKGKSFHFRVIAECGAIQSISIFVAAVLAFPALFWKRIVGVLVGVPVLYAINVFRLATLGVIGAFVDQETFDFYHEVVWQGIYIVFVVVVWLIWMEVLVRGRKPRKEAPAT